MAYIGYIALDSLLTWLRLAHSVDWAVRSRLHWFLSGGLNLQSVHHCFPTVDHSHLPALRRILEEVCAHLRHNLTVGVLDGFRLKVPQTVTPTSSLSCSSGV